VPRHGNGLAGPQAGFRRENGGRIGLLDYLVARLAALRKNEGDLEKLSR
jgi:hypothetical protein